MSISDGKKEIYVAYLDTQRTSIYRSILECNRELVTSLYKKTLASTVNGDPLWLFHGGELINLYSDKAHAVPTKDIDLKLYFTGDYSLPPKIYKKGLSLIPPIYLRGFDFYDGPRTASLEAKLLRPFKTYMTKAKTPSQKSCYQLWSTGETQKVDLCVSLVGNSQKGTFSQLNLNSGQLKEGLSTEDILQGSRSGQKSVCGDTWKVFVANVPYVTQVGRDNVPYDIDDKILHKMGTEYDEDIDGYYIDEDIVRKIGTTMEAWTMDERVPTVREKQEYLRRKLRIVRLKNQKYKLSSVIGVALVYNESRGQWYLFQEGILDLYIDYSAGHHLQQEKRYLGRYEDGSFPSVVKRVNYGSQKSLMRVPSLPWLIYDQLRMLYVTIRGSYLGCDETQCKWVTLGGGAAGNSAKYFKKLQGLLKSFETMIRHLQEGNLTEVSQELSMCKGQDLETCGPLAFITTLFQTFEFEFLKGTSGTAQASKRSKRSKRHAKRAQRSKRSKRLTKRAPSSKGNTHTCLIDKMTDKNKGLHLD